MTKFMKRAKFSRRLRHGQIKAKLYQSMTLASGSTADSNGESDICHQFGSIKLKWDFKKLLKDDCIKLIQAILSL